MVRSYGDVKWGVGKKGDFAKGFSLHREGLLPTVLPRIVVMASLMAKLCWQCAAIWLKEPLLAKFQTGPAADKSSGKGELVFRLLVNQKHELYKCMVLCGHF